ncbi:S-layer homology domain-containing protein [Paenibacillus sp. N1-5-1-14]|uniref:YcdB/YcdC domain-containing protein n=1 Tax=Paenibacillus radicibacter TaxID=2972488 RepID=UPI00215963D6|nr:YcdB/YcdC domain-containing protein [Paenibacillus radicibacter]MCR8645687.1 S-layer homology domain-containing protein [Paenibacillus radicibacter]
MKRPYRTLSKAMLTTAISASLLVPSAAFAAEQGTVVAVPKENVVIVKDSKAVHKYTEADAKITKDEAVERIRKLFPKLKDAEVRGIQFGVPNQYPRPNENVWTIEWQIREGNGSYGFSSRIAADTGDFLQVSVNNYPRDREQNVVYYPPKVTKEKASELAKAFVLQASPSLTAKDFVESKETHYDVYDATLFGPVRYTFSYDVLVQGVKVQDGGIRVTVDGNGEVSGIYRQALGNDIASSKPTLTLDQATKYAKDNQMAELQYIPDRKNSGEISKWYLGYVPFLYPIDAQTGRILEDGNNYDITGKKYKRVPATEGTYTGHKGQAELTAEQAAKLVEDAFGIPKEKKLENSSTQDNWNNSEEKLWHLNWAEEGQQSFEGRIYASILVKQGFVRDYSSNQYMMGVPKVDDALPSISKEDAEKKAILLLNKVYPNASQELRQVVSPDSTSKITNYSFTFQRFYKDIPVSGDTVNINMDLQGNISSYYANRSDVADKDLDTLKPVVTKEQALEKVWKNTKLELNYIYVGGIYNGNPDELRKMGLVYTQSLKDNPFMSVIDAADGNWKKQWYGIADAKTSIAPVDIKGHVAEKELDTLIQFKVLSTDDAGKVNPNQAVTIGEWWTMLAKAHTSQFAGMSFSNDKKQPFADIDEKNEYYDAIRFALQYKWLEANATLKLGPEQELTREQFASYLVSVTKYSKLSKEIGAKFPSLSYADSSQITNKGDVWLATQLGLLKAKDGKFSPKDKVTRAEAATAIMSLVYLQGKLDQGVSNNYPY